jgi:ribosomal protein S18 acetylase RimI-like enzyme
MDDISTFFDTEIITLRGGSPILYVALGPFLGAREVERELGAALRNAPGKAWTVGFEDGEVVGFCAAERRGRWTVMCSDWVHPECRGRGIYDLLFAARNRITGGPMRATATGASVGTFTRYGFVQVGRRGRYHRMEKK